jgi:alkaline phosphatase
LDSIHRIPYTPVMLSGHRPIALALAAILGCAAPTADSSRPLAAVPARAPRGLVLVIGDGMGPGQLALLLRAHPDGAFAALLRDGAVGLVDPTPYGALVTDSAAGGTALATGVQTRPRMIAVDPEGRRVDTLLEAAARRGLATGVVTTADLTDATPATFLAHSIERTEYAEIARQIVASPPTIAIGGGAKWFAHPPASIHALAPGDLPYRRQAPRPSLAALTTQALAAVDREHHGFVVVVEAALIDNACHEHLAPELLGELLDLDEALAMLRSRAAAGELTLVVTADHETGGFGLQFREPATPPPSLMLASGLRWSPVADFGSEADLDALRRGETTGAVTWATEAHTATLIPLVAAGPGAAAFGGFHAQWQIGQLLRAASEALRGP